MKNIIILGISAGLNRGSLFLILPILATFLSLRDFGELSVFLISAQLLIPFVSLNIAAIIAREAYEKPFTTAKFTTFINNVLFSLIVISILLYIFFGSVLILALLYALVESLFLINSTYVRFKGDIMNYLKLTLIKFISFFISLLLFSLYNAKALESLKTILLSLIIANIIIIPLSYNLSSKLNLKKVKRNVVSVFANKYLFLFSLGLIPHILAQWVTSGSDRYIVQYQLGGEALGLYSLSYSIASIFMLINSALALGLPQICVRSYSKFTLYSFFFKIFISITSLWLLFSLVVFFIFPYIYPHVAREDIFDVTFWILLGLYNLAYYYYFSSVLFYQRKVKYLSFVTVITAIINLILVFVLTPIYGITGTAFATYLAYFTYTLLVSLKCDKKLRLYMCLPILFNVFLCFFYYLFLF
jgi:O-antigen/teichoic acid export membrane protein